MKKDIKQRVTAFVDPILIKRAKIRGALEGLTISEIVESALDAYAPKIEKDGDEHINIKFAHGPIIDALISEIATDSKKKTTKRSKTLTVPR